MTWWKLALAIVLFHVSGMALAAAILGHPHAPILAVLAPFDTVVGLAWLAIWRFTE